MIDLSLAIGCSAIEHDADANIIVTEYNRTVQAFLVGQVDRIVNLNWEDVIPPPKSSGSKNYLTAITRIDDKMVEILDVERVLSDVIHVETEVSASVLDKELCEKAKDLEVLLVDDSSVAIQQARAALRQIGLKVTVATDGLQALKLLQSWRDEGINVPEKLLMVITDAEMPEMDGYRLTTEIRNDPALKDIFVILHTSLSGSFNSAMVQKVGCDGFLSKFQPDALAEAVQNRIRDRLNL